MDHIKINQIILYLLHFQIAEQSAVEVSSHGTTDKIIFNMISCSETFYQLSRVTTQCQCMRKTDKHKPVKLLQMDREMCADTTAPCATLKHCQPRRRLHYLSQQPHQSEQKMSECNKVLYCKFAFGLHSLDLKRQFIFNNVTELTIYTVHEQHFKWIALHNNTIAFCRAAYIWI